MKRPVSLPVERLYEFESLASTQDFARKRLEAHPGANEVIWVRADRQSEGRGRQGRRWEDTKAPGETLLVSLGFRPSSRLARSLPLLPLWAGALALSVARELGHDESLFLKWPNDLVRPGAGASLSKVGGILVEAFGARGVVVGWGINLFSAPADVGASPLFASRAEDPLGFRDRVWARLRERFARENAAWSADVSGTYEESLIEFLERDAMAPLWGREGVLLAESRRGRAVGLNGDGTLRVLLPDGTRYEARSGEFRLDREAPRP